MIFLLIHSIIHSLDTFSLLGARDTDDPDGDPTLTELPVQRGRQVRPQAITVHGNNRVSAVATTAQGDKREWVVGEPGRERH